MKKYSILSYIINDYEPVREIKLKSPYAEYLLVTDNPELRSSTWDVIYDPSLKNLATFDKCYTIRFNPFRYCNTDICLRVDGSMQILSSLDDLVSHYILGDYDFATVIHPARNRIDDEYKVWTNTRGLKKKDADRALQMMHNTGYKFRYKGLFQIGLFLMRKNKICDDINRLTFDLLKIIGSEEEIHRLDQTVFTFVVNTFFRQVKVMPLDEEFIHSQYIQLKKHNTQENMPMPHTIAPYMFNKRIKTIHSSDLFQKILYETPCHNNSI